MRKFIIEFVKCESFGVVGAFDTKEKALEYVDKIYNGVTLFDLDCSKDELESNDVFNSLKTGTMIMYYIGIEHPVERRLKDIIANGNKQVCMLPDGNVVLIVDYLKDNKFVSNIGKIHITEELTLIDGVGKPIKEPKIKYRNGDIVRGIVGIRKHPYIEDKKLYKVHKEKGKQAYINASGAHDFKKLNVNHLHYLGLIELF